MPSAACSATSTCASTRPRATSSRCRSTNRLVDRSDPTVTRRCRAGRHRQGLRRAGRAARGGGHRLDRHRAAQQRQRRRLQHAGRRADRRRAAGRHRGAGLRRCGHRLHEPRRRAHPRLHLQAARQRRRRQRHLRRGLHRAALRQQPGDDDAERAGHQGRAGAAVRRLPRPAAERHAHHAAVGRLQVPLGRHQGLRRSASIR